MGVRSLGYGPCGYVCADERGGRIPWDGFRSTAWERSHPACCGS